MPQPGDRTNGGAREPRHLATCTGCAAKAVESRGATPAALPARLPPAPAGAAPAPATAPRLFRAPPVTDGATREAANGEATKPEGLDASSTLSKRRRELGAGGVLCTSFPPRLVHCRNSQPHLRRATAVLLAGLLPNYGTRDLGELLRLPRGATGLVLQRALAPPPVLPTTPLHLAPRCCCARGCSGAQPDDWRGQGSAGGCGRSRGGKEHQRLHHRQSRVRVSALAGPPAGASRVAEHAGAQVHRWAVGFEPCKQHGALQPCTGKAGSPPAWPAAGPSLPVPAGAGWA